MASHPGRVLKSKYFLMTEHQRQFNHLTLLRRFRKNESLTNKVMLKWYWECRCVCGKITQATECRICTGVVKCCGCTNKLHYTGAKHRLWKGVGELSGACFASIAACAKNRGIEFTVTKEEIWDLFLKQNEKCALTGLPISFNSNQSPTFLGRQKTASLDRIDSSKPYTLDNVHWTHKDINVMKNDHSTERFVELCRHVTEHHAQISTSNVPSTLAV